VRGVRRIPVRKVRRIFGRALSLQETHALASSTWFPFAFSLERPVRSRAGHSDLTFAMAFSNIA